MVGPSLSEERRRTAGQRLRTGFVALVGLSGGLVAIANGASAFQAVGAAGAGLLVGAALLGFLTRAGRDWQRSRRR